MLNIKNEKSDLTLSRNLMHNPFNLMFTTVSGLLDFYVYLSQTYVTKLGKGKFVTYLQVESI